ncbi:hypothetical protein AAFM71_09600 [Chromobacterium violaceum]|uniref:hypothetical protein n=1 Tax=Chromobacterium violaceum TaxID=536 RepID=UPI00385FEFEE
MINPPVLSLRRRAAELRASAERELPHNEDSAALLIFYAAECALKATYMLQNNLRSPEEVRGSAQSARSFGHNLVALVSALRIPRQVTGDIPQVMLSRTGTTGHVQHLHEAWRYGEKVENSQAIFQWLNSLIDWSRKTT